MTPAREHSLEARIFGEQFKLSKEMREAGYPIGLRFKAAKDLERSMRIADEFDAAMQAVKNR